MQKFITERARTERDSWLNWASAASARLAAAINADTGKLFALLEGEVREQLRQLAGRSVKESGNGSSNGMDR